MIAGTFLAAPFRARIHRRPLFLLLLRFLLLHHRLGPCSAATEAIAVPQSSFELSASGASPWGSGFTSSSGQQRPSIKCRVTDAAEMCPGGVSATFCKFQQNGAAPSGLDFATILRQGAAATKVLRAETTTTMEASRTYNVRVWSRGLNAHWGGTAAGAAEAVTAKARARVALTAGGTATMASATLDVGAPIMKGDARTATQDDGANVWIERVAGKDYRMHTGEGFLVQEMKSGVDPVSSPWTILKESASFGGMAKAPVVTPEGLKAISGTWYQAEADQGPVWSKISIHRLTVTTVPVEGERNFPFTFTFDGLKNDGDAPTQVKIRGWRGLLVGWVGG